MGGLLSELKRRHIYRVAAAYAVVAWIVLQIVNNVAPGLNLPNSAVTLVIVLLAAGFPIALIFAWVLELKSPDAAPKTGASDWVLAAVALAFIGMFAVQQFAPSRATVTAAQPGVEAARAASARPLGISVAVLPFENLSDDKQQEFFSDGMTEEITAALAKIPDLRVVARTSAYEFKGKNIGIENIGQQLHATHLIEGSVRKAGNRVRVTAQLIKADDGTHIWAENYDRDLTDVFGIQEDVARAIAASLNMSLGLKPGENLVNNRDIDPNDYQQFLRALALVNGRGAPRIAEAISVLEGIVARHPNYAPAWIWLAGAYGLAPNSRPERNGTAQEFRRVVDAYFAKSDVALRRGVQLDPNNAAAYALMSGRDRVTGKELEADDYLNRAIALDPYWGISHAQALQFEQVGRVKEALAIREQLLAVEPFVPLYKSAITGTLWINGRNDEAIALAKTLPSADGVPRLAMIYASMGRYTEAADQLANAQPGTNSRAILDAAAAVLRTAPAKADVQKLPALNTQLAWVYLTVGAESRVLDNYETLLEGGRLPGQEMGWLWHPIYAPVRKTERFKAFARKAGFVEYWRAKGWPEQCHPTTGEDFECN